MIAVERGDKRPKRKLPRLYDNPSLSVVWLSLLSAEKTCSEKPWQYIHKEKHKILESIHLFGSEYSEVRGKMGHENNGEMCPRDQRRNLTRLRKSIEIKILPFSRDAKIG